ncbi:hypothetical protein DSL72_000024 [Monilinia vaccinii-corymbosi]|uniref:Uncharacterized protein n=1 Tax=Monilinia vaccinii-corymbosi TaxID=61207 RepID=A0A8A3P1X4_9HELO|nr:hypothetical protein DSL72_000024 [Monilinia vaccinii-corymbosi]
MSSFIKKQCKSISHQISQAGPVRTLSRNKPSAQISPSGISNVDKITQGDHKFQVSHQSKKEPSENISSQPSSKSNGSNTPSSEPTKPKNSPTESSSGSLESTTIHASISNTTSVSHLTNTVVGTTKSNKNGPDEKYQINSHLLFEHSFPGHTFISVHLQRLQHGVYSDANLHTQHTMHVTFVALSIVFHPSTPAHRFESAVIDIRVKDQGGNLRFLKYAPHQAYGRISTESLKWNFQLGASVGVTQGPAKLCVSPSISEEKSKVVGTMMKIQASTRSTFSHSTRRPDTLLHFSLEENIQQESGLPRELTFVFLLERPSKKQHPPVHTFHSSSRIKTLEHRVQEKLKGLGDMNEGKETEECMRYEYQDLAGERKGARERLDADFEGVFGEVEFEICVEPRVSGTLKLPSIGPHTETATVAGEVGQKFPTEGTLDSVGKIEHPEVMVDGLYNFAKMGGAFEEQVSFPGASVGSRVPDVGGGGDKR